MAYTLVQQFWYLLSMLGKKEEYLSVLSHYGVSSFRFLNVQKQEELVDSLDREWKDRCKRPRGAVIHYLCVMPGYNYKINGEPDYDRINEWVKSKFQGKALNQLSLQDLNKAVSMVKRWYEKQLKTSIK